MDSSLCGKSVMDKKERDSFIDGLRRFHASKGWDHIIMKLMTIVIGFDSNLECLKVGVTVPQADLMFIV